MKKAISRTTKTAQKPSLALGIVKTDVRRTGIAGQGLILRNV
jgi:hypothetical protein